MITYCRQFTNDCNGSDEIIPSQVGSTYQCLLTKYQTEFGVTILTTPPKNQLLLGTDQKKATIIG
jgi:hypothetical protein